MDVSVTNVNNAYYQEAGKISENNKKDAKSKTVKEESPSVVYEKSSAASNEKKDNKNEKITFSSLSKADQKTIEKLKAEVEQRTAQLRSLVEKLLMKQGTIHDMGSKLSESDFIKAIKSGNLEVDAKTVEEAKAEIGEDGYWGVNKTSDRLVDFAKALAGQDKTKADKMIEAIKKGYGDAGKAWGGELPEICNKTLNAAIEKLEAWRDSKDDENEASSFAANQFKAQGSAQAISK
ncbi:MAG: hypothetical protein MJ113_03355 [Lachnospiraceae bacterium]|nr:hypothetical protein [Lachnospiraceae bacterium]